MTVFEAARTLGGRARALPCTLHDGSEVTLDNGQHILIGAYSETRSLLQTVGVNTDAALLRLPMTMVFPDGCGLRFPEWPAPLDAAWAILGARGWSVASKWSLVRTALSWRLRGFHADPRQTVAALCANLRATPMADLIEPLCVSALNTPARSASAEVFLRVLHDALFARSGGSNLLLPKVNLGALFPEAAAGWLQARGAKLVAGHRVNALEASHSGWQVEGQAFDKILLATAPWDAARIVQASGIEAAQWLEHVNALHYEAIATVYVQAERGLSHPMLALRSSAAAPAQFAFDRGQLGGPSGLLAFVVSAATGEREVLQRQVMAQAQSLAEGLGLGRLQALQTVVERRATFACTPALQRPSMRIAPGLLACGDYIEGPYPSTLEGAVRSGLAAGDAVAAGRL